uniref:LIM/homeobox protein Awh n=1 Tax=Globodera pallida TaxID=36090 RepID=A0A183CDS9_GLOPA
MGSSAAPFLPSSGGQIGAFPTFPAPLLVNEDGLVAAVAAFPPLAAFGFGTFCPDDQPQQQLFIHTDEQQHQFIPIPGPFLDDVPFARFGGDENQMLVNMACGTFLTDSVEQNFFHSTHSTNATFIPPINQDPAMFVSTDRSVIAPHSLAAIQLEELTKIEKIEEDSKSLVYPSSTRRGHPTQRGGMRRRVTERVGRSKIGRNSNPSAVTTPNNALNCDEKFKEEIHLQQQLLEQLDPTTISDASKLMLPSTTVPSEYSTSGIIVPEEPKRCAQCAGDIRDRTMLAVGIGTPEFFHCECLKCCECADVLENVPKCYVRAERTYCAECYAKNFGICCAMCERRIASTDWVRRAREFVYHLACFKCEHCKRQLVTGDKFSLDDAHRPPPAIPRLLCSPHYSELVLGEQSNPKQKAKRVRTTFGEDQLAVLQQYFKVDSNPDGADLERIASKTGLTKRVTQVWFQNSRARQKKYHGHAPCRKSAVVPGGGVASSSASASIASGMDMCLGDCRSATLTPSSSSSNGAHTAGQSPILFGRGGSTGSESDGFRQLLVGPTSPSATSG